MPFDKLKEPDIKFELPGEEALKDSVIKNRLSKDDTKSQMAAVIAWYSDSELSKNTNRFIAKELAGTNCTKIVVFGGGSLSYAKQRKMERFGRMPVYGMERYPIDWYPFSCLIQHASVLSIRSSLEKIAKQKIAVYLADTEYTEIDKEVAKDYEMEVVNQNPGFEQGWLQLDETTLFINLYTFIPGLPHLISEIARPAAMLSLQPFEVVPRQDLEYAPFSFTVHDFDKEEILIPGLGINGYTAKVQEFLNEYKVASLYPPNYPVPVSPFWGGSPKLYIRKQQ